MSARDQQLLGWKAGDHLVAGLGDDNLLLDACGAPTVGGRPKSLERKNHTRLDLARMVKGDQPADHRFFPNRKTDPMAVLQRKTSLFIREPKFFRLGPN